jgi:hypothetical protein
MLSGVFGGVLEDTTSLVVAYIHTSSPNRLAPNAKFQILLSQYANDKVHTTS